MPERSVFIAGSVAGARVIEMRQAIEAIADQWVSDDIVVDLRDVQVADLTIVTGLVAGGEYARHLGHRVLVRARQPIARLLEQGSSANAYVLLPG